MKRVLLIFLTLSLLVSCSLVSCTEKPTPSASFFLMDTMITVTLYTDEETAGPILAECRSMLEELDRLWSRTKEESDTSRFNASEEGLMTADERTIELLQVALDVSLKTDGAFDVTVAPLVTLWQTCEKAGRLPTESELAAAMKTVGATEIVVEENSLLKKNSNVKIDLGGIGKGAAISKIVSYIEYSGISGGLVSFGSNVAVIGRKPNGKDFRIALRDPKNTNASAGTLTLRAGEVLSVSGDYERFYVIDGKNYHHILDPKTGYPAESGLSSVAVVCRDGALADALSTALLVMGEERARAFYAAGFYEFEAVFISDTGVISTTDRISFN